MSITDELRKWVRDGKGSLLAIADRIDAEHEAMLVDARKTVYQGYIELPKDADNVPWHVGERDEDGMVIELWLTSDGWWVCADGVCRRPYCIRHHHATTVEEVLREFADEVYADADNEIRDRDFLCAKYAKRLTLAEGEDA